MAVQTYLTLRIVLKSFGVEAKITVAEAWQQLSADEQRVVHALWHQPLGGTFLDRIYCVDCLKNERLIRCDRAIAANQLLRGLYLLCFDFVIHPLIGWLCSTEFI